MYKMGHDLPFHRAHGEHLSRKGKNLQKDVSAKEKVWKINNMLFISWKVFDALKPE